MGDAYESVAVDLRCTGQPARLAIVEQILAREDTSAGAPGAEFAEQMATAICQFMTDRTVAEVLTGSSPP